MSHFYFDQPDGFDLTREDIGLYLDGVEDAKAAVNAAIVDMTRNQLSDACFDPQLPVHVHSTSGYDVDQTNVT